MEPVEKRTQPLVPRRTLRLVGFAVLVMTIGVVSCQALIGAPLPQ
jgi:hypothetical protein